MANKLVWQLLLIVCFMILLLNDAKSKEVKRKENAQKKKQVVCQKQTNIFPAHGHYYQCKSKVITVILKLLILIVLLFCFVRLVEKRFQKTILKTRRYNK